MIYVAFCFLSGVVGGVIGVRRGSSYFVWFIVSAVVPVLGPIAALLHRRETEEPLRRCPGCGAALRAYDALCMRCGTELSYPAADELIEPDPAIRVRARL